MSGNFNQNKILKNSIYLYFRMFITMGLNLYTTRLVLTNLGVENLGVYGMVGSLISVFSILTSGITNAIQRFITYEYGLRNGNVNKIFYTSLNVIFIMSGIILLLFESVGIWILNNKINIPIESRNAAFWVFQLSVLTCLITLISIPYNALIIAREKMGIFAFISTFQVILNCIAAYLLSFFNNERLLVYSLFMTAISLIIRIIYQIYCRLNFSESQYHLAFDKKIIKSISSYTGISTISGVLQMISSQGITFIINWTFGVSLNAVYDIAMQVKNAIISFSLNLFKAISPQITKTYASGELEKHKKLVYSGSKLEVYLIYFIMIPFLFKTEYIMKLWLGNVPDYTIAFTRCTVFISLTYAAFEPIRTAVLATNRIIKFMIIPDSFYLLVLPISYFIGKMTNNPLWIITIIVALDIATCIFRIYIASQICSFTLKSMLSKIIAPCIKVAILSGTTCYLLSSITPQSFCGFTSVLVLNSIFLILYIFFIGMNKEEKIFLLTTIKLFNLRYKKKNG